MLIQYSSLLKVRKGQLQLILATVEFLVAFSVSMLSTLSAGWDLGTALFLGSVLGLSSTAIVANGNS